jgi:hypothetical protein
MSFLAQVSYTGNGSTTQYSITFPYIDVTHVKAYLNGTLTSAYTISSSTLTFTTAPANGVVIRIERETPNDNRLVDFTDGSVLTEQDLDRSADQNFYIAQEITDDSASKLGLDTDDKYNAQSKVIKNLASPVADTDAVNKAFISTNLPNINTVAGISADVTTVAGISGNVTTVAGNNANVSTVATNIASVNTVATNIADVITVANDLNEAISEIETTANDLNEAVSEIDTVGTNIASVQAVGTDIANVNTVATDIANVNTVATDIANVNTVGGAIANVNTVAGANANITTVANANANINTVATDIANVNLVGGSIANVNTVATNVANVNTVASNNANINTVASANANITTLAGISADITTVATNSANISTIATDIAKVITTANDLNEATSEIEVVANAIANVDTVGTNIANVNLVGGSIANVNTVGSNIGTVNEFGERYRVSASAPSTSLDLGDLYFDTASNTMKVYSSGGWINAGSSVNGTADRFKYTATASQTTFTGADDNGNTLGYDAGFLDVYLNGIRLVNGSDFTASSGTSIVLTTGASASDILEVVAFGTFQLVNFSITDANDVPVLGSAGQVLKVNSGATSLEYVDGTITINGSTVALGGSTTIQTVTYPTITSIAPDTITNDATSIVITGTNYVITPLVEIISTSGKVYFPNTVTRNSATQLTVNATIPDDGTYFIRVENPDGLAVRSSTALLTVSDAPTWTTASGSLGSVAQGASFSTTVVATSDSAITYSVQSGALPTGITLNTSTGVISGTESGVDTGETVYNFTVRATDAESQTADRAFSITVTVGINNAGQFN